jgi:hypothetical protein
MHKKVMNSRSARVSLGEVSQFFVELGSPPALRVGKKTGIELN